MKKVDKTDHLLTNEQNDLKSIKSDLNDAKIITDVMFAKTATSRRSMGITVKCAVSGIQFEVSDSLHVMDELLDLAIALKHQDDVNYYNWKSCDDGWFCVAKAHPPARMVPQNVADGLTILRAALVRWGADLTVITNCVRNVDEICDKALLAMKVGEAKTKFVSVYRDWDTFKEALCKYHKWHVCDNYSLLVNLDAKMNEPIEMDLKWGMNPIPALFGCPLMMALVVFVWRLRGRKHTTMRQPLLL